MNYSDPKLKLESVKFCNKIGCKGEHTYLIQCLWKQNVFEDQIFFCADRITIDELICCHALENKEICNYCDNCEAWMKFLEFRLELKTAYFYSPRTDALYQPTVSKKKF